MQFSRFVHLIATLFVKTTTSTFLLLIQTLVAFPCSLLDKLSNAYPHASFRPRVWKSHHFKNDAFYQMYYGLKYQPQPPRIFFLFSPVIHWQFVENPLKSSWNLLRKIPLWKTQNFFFFSPSDLFPTKFPTFQWSKSLVFSMLISGIFIYLSDVSGT